MNENDKIIAELIFRLHQIDISRYDATFLSNTIEKRMQETNCSSVQKYIYLLENNLKEANDFVDSIQVCYSKFFRNPLTFSVLEKIILPSLLAKSKKNEIRIWSAACAAGQETYSLAILFNEYSSAEKINFRIFATDQSEKQIEIAQKGEYPMSALESMSVKRLNDWFNKQGSIYSVKPKLKEKSEFSTFDLFSEQFHSPPTSIFGDFDIVFCANLLFYYQQEYREIIVNKVNNSLAESGILITSETERDILIQWGFQELYPQSAIFRKKPKNVPLNRNI